MKKKLTITLLILAFNLGFSQELEKKEHEMVQAFIDGIKSNNINKLKTQVVYPLKRKYPLSDIYNESEFEKRYTEILDPFLKANIVSSNIKTDWAIVGWRGIMFNNGDLWLDNDGRLTTVNYLSKLEKNKRFKLIENDKKSIHESLNKFKEPVLIIETTRFKIRIDLLNNGKYRYASWPINSKTHQKPDLILKNGIWRTEGSGGNHRYKFVNGNYQYDCVIYILGETEHPSAELIVYQNNKIILSEPGQIIREQ